MSKWFDHANLKIVNKTIGQVREAIVVTSSLGLFAFLIAAPSMAADSDQPAAEVTEASTPAEGSVLVATRAATEAETPAPESPTTPAAAAIEGEALEPVSQIAERTPELATTGETTSDQPPVSTDQPVANTTDDEDDAAEFGAALAKVATTEPGVAELAKPKVKRTAVREAVPFAPAKFQNMVVGEATQSELISAWGQPVDTISTPDGAVLTYDTEPFQAVEVLVAGDTVTAIKIALAANLESKQLAKQLSLDQFEPVTVTDENGLPLGQAFPERGVLFMYSGTEERALLPIDDTTTPTVSHVAIQPLDARAFALRAENRLHGPYQQNIRDLNTALALEPELAHVHWLLAEIYLATGQADLADGEATEACELEPANATYQLCRTRTMTLLGQYDEAVHQVRAVLDREDITPLARAQALHEMARLASLGDVQIAAKAVPFDTKAIEIADKLATSKDSKERRAAKELLVEAHLAIAEEIARQAFNNKVESLSMWIGRASGLAEDYITNDGGSVELRLRVAQSALAALSSFKPTLDPAPWVAEAEAAANDLFARSDDKLWQQHVQWELGGAYLHALRVEHLRQKTETALDYGQSAIENMAEGASSRQAVHTSEQLVGQLYFYMGAVYAVHQQDHTKAAQWYDKAAPLLTGPRPVSELYSPRREGEVLVSMGVTYWQLGQQARALEITQSGASLVEMAVEDGILAKSALSVPYGNLASMYEQMGETTNASKYAGLAETASKPTVNPRTGRAMYGNTRTASSVQMNPQQRMMRR